MQHLWRWQAIPCTFTDKMIFRTEIQPISPPFRLSLQQPLLSVGSCFAGVIGERLQSAKFKVLVNPFGTIFHPLPMVKLLDMALKEEEPASFTYLCYQQRWLNYLLHSSINAPTQQALQQRVKEILKLTREQLQSCQALLLTLGTSFVYELITPGLSVANCHKQPQKLFHKRLTEVAETFQALDQLWSALKAVNPHLKLVLTVSPVRHLKDSLELNSLSKAMLRLVCHQLVQKHPQDIYYFPSYELLMDDLRDYRFYEQDLLHPNLQAQEYVWEKFTTSLLDQQAQDFLIKWHPLQQALQHRPFNPTSAAHRQFLEKTLQKLQALPFAVNVSDEIKQVQEQLSHE